MRLLFLLIVISSTSFSQTSIKAKIKDVRGNALPFTNVVSLKTNYGTITNENGEFEIHNLPPFDTLKITNISFVPKFILISTLHNNEEIILIDSIRKLDDVIVRNFNSYKKISSLGYSSSSNRGEFKLIPGNQIAVYINNSKNKEGWIKNITFGIKDFGKCNNSLRLRLLEADSVSLYPTNDLLLENLIIENSLLKKKNKIDLSSYKILMPPNGIFIMLEWVIDTNCDKNSYTSIAANLETAANVVWLNYRDKKWGHSNRPRLPNGNFMTPNFGIEVAY
jgi:hypothetical protein